PEILREALRQLKTGRPRPVEIEIPFDLWPEKVEVPLTPVEAEAPIQPRPDEIKKAAEILSNAKRPLILAGGGGAKSDVGKEITRLAKVLRAPVVMTTEGQGVIHCENPWCAGNFVLWLNPALARADVILVAGSRLRASGNTSLEPGPDQKIIQIDFDAEELGKNLKIDLGIAADAHAALTTLLQELPDPQASQWQEAEVAEIRSEMRARLEKAAPRQIAILRSIYDVLGDDSIIVPDITNVGYWCDLAYPINKPRSNVDSSYFATLGFAFPTALGAKIGNPDKNVVALCGDGGFPYAAMELATAMQEGINVITLLFSDNAYGTVTGIQRQQFGGRFIGNRLYNPDYVKFAESFGAIGIRLSNHEEIKGTLRSALTADRPVVIEIPV
ncbi:MAG: thiamine pyrophosphate-binding protein, partial [Fidelibacterota bacterium]